MKNQIFVTNAELGREYLSDLLERGDFFYVKMRNTDTDAEHICAFGWGQNEDTVHFYSDLRCFDGNYSMFRIELGFAYSWSCHSVNFARDIQYERNGWEYLGIANDCEIRVSGARQFLHSEYTSETMYRGQGEYHSDRSYNDLVRAAENDPYRIGVELEVECTSEQNYNTVRNKVQSNWIMMEEDSSLGCYGIEFITIPLLPKHAKSKATWEDLVEYLSDHATSWDTGRCGLHVHIGRNILGSSAEERSETTGKLLFLYHHYLKENKLNSKIFGRERGYHERDGKIKEGEDAKVFGGAPLKLKSVQTELKNKLISRNSSERYFDINLKNANTIEFRKGRGSINAGRITAIVAYCELMCLYARKVKWDKISDSHFFDYLRKHISKSSPLNRFLAKEELDC